ncbi:MAG: histidine phosphatase family protein, partial [Clostridia bacterium]|nr:histidine phosphatase family protein [Clostridia bacterium]
MKTTVYLVRHAESDHSVRDAKTRPLTENGLKDAEKLTEFFEGISVSRVFSSPYLRAVQTVKPLSDKRNLPIQTDERMREWMGGRPFPHEIFEKRMREMFEDESSTNGGAESLKALKKRTGEFIMHLLTRFPGETIVVAAHAL